MRYKTEVTTTLDPEELHEDQQLGEGSFGIVFKGTFRNNTFVTKKMKKSLKMKKK